MKKRQFTGNINFVKIITSENEAADNMCPERVTGSVLRDLLRADIGAER